MKYFGVVLLIKHPSIDPAVISSELKLEAFRSWKAGESRATPTGTPLPGTWRDSSWNHVFSYKGERKFFDEIRQLLIQLLPHKDFLLKISNEGGRVEIYLQLPGDLNQGSSAEPAMLKEMAELGLYLGVEVFPEWGDDPRNTVGVTRR